MLQEKILELSGNYALLEEQYIDLQNKFNLLSRGTAGAATGRTQSPIKSSSDGVARKQLPPTKTTTKPNITKSGIPSSSSPTMSLLASVQGSGSSSRIDPKHSSPENALSIDSKTQGLQLRGDIDPLSPEQVVSRKEATVSVAASPNGTEGDSEEQRTRGRSDSSSSFSSFVSASNPTKGKRKSILKSTVKFFMGMGKSSSKDREELTPSATFEEE